MNASQNALPNPGRRAFLKLSVSTTAAAALTPLAASQTEASEADADIAFIDIGSRRELFVDHHLIERLEGQAQQQLHHPIPREIALVHDEPWEGTGCGYHSVFQDGDLYRMYYCVINPKNWGWDEQRFDGKLPVTRRFPMNKKYIVRLSEQERQSCKDVIAKLNGTSQKVRRAQIMLKADADGPSWTDARIAEAFNCRLQTIENLRKRCVTESFELALNGKKRQTPPTQPLLDGKGEAKLISMRLGKPPAGYGRWTLQLLADELVALEVVDSISHETVRKTLKKTG